MLVLNILIGLLGLGIVVFIHEGGHFLLAKAVGIQVETFSLGWGKRIAGFKKGGTDYRISAFPVGGYCKMKGENLLQQAWEENSSTIPREEGSLFAAKPWKRILVLLAGPGVNLLFAIIVSAIVWWIGFSITTFGNKIILASDVAGGGQETTYPADKAGLQTGDVITSVDGRPVKTYRDLQEVFAQNANTTLQLTVKRNGSTKELTITPSLDTSTGAGQVGIYPWVEPVIGNVRDGSPADIAGLAPGDTIVRADGKPIQNSMDFVKLVQATGKPISVTYRRDGTTHQTKIVPGMTSDGRAQVGLGFKPLEVRSPRLGALGAVARGTGETFHTLVLTVRSLRLLFSGVDLTQAVAGPLRITYFIGEVATQGFSLGVGEGLRAFFNFLSLLSVALFFMNLLPIPVLDGGQIVLYAVEGISRRPLHPRVVYWYQLVGTILILMILVFALFGDILFFAHQ